MSISIQFAPCAKGAVLPLCAENFSSASAGEAGQGVCGPMAAHVTAVRPVPFWPVGTVLYRCDTPPGEISPGDSPMLAKCGVARVVGRVLVPGSPHAQLCPLLEALTDISCVSLELDSQRQGRALAWITLSDKGYQGQREDLSGPALEALVREHLPLCHSQGFILPDEPAPLKALLLELALGQGYDLICTTGGTGIGPRDISPEATLPLLEKRLHGFEQAMMQASLAKTPHASISRSVAGVVGGCIVINTPGSRKAVLENLAAVMPALAHALDKLHGDPADCGG